MRHYKTTKACLFAGVCAYLYNVPNGSRRDQADLQEPSRPAGSVLKANLFASAFPSNILKTLEGFCLYCLMLLCFATLGCEADATPYYKSK